MVESAIAATFVCCSLVDGHGNGSSGRRPTAADDSNVHFVRGQDDDIVIYLWGGAMEKYLLARIILLYLGKASKREWGGSEGGSGSGSSSGC